MAGRLWETAGADTRCARRSPSPRELSRWPDPQTGRSAGTDTDHPCSLSPPAHGSAFLSTVASSDRSFAVAVPADRPPCWATVSPHAAAFLQLGHRASLLQPDGDRIPWEGRFPPRSPHTAAASRRSPCAAATPHDAFEVAERSECAGFLARSGNPTELGDPLPTLGFQARSTPDPMRCLPDDTYCSRAGFQPGPGGVRAQAALALRQLSCACRAPYPRYRRGGRWQAKTQTCPRSGRFLSTGCN